MTDIPYSTKRSPSPYDGYAKALEDEPYFVLIGRDPMAGPLILLWAMARRAAGEDPDKVTAAIWCARDCVKHAFELGKWDAVLAAIDRFPAADMEELSDFRKRVALYAGGAPESYRCSKCSAHGCKLWRQYQTFANHVELLCAACAVQNQHRAEEHATSVPKSVDAIDADGRWENARGSRGDQIGWLVPAVPTEDKTFWGYTSVPSDGIAWWRRLPTRL